LILDGDAMGGIANDLERAGARQLGANLEPKRIGQKRSKAEGRSANAGIQSLSKQVLKTSQSADFCKSNEVIEIWRSLKAGGLHR
jgi:hypothetical protein